MKAGGFGWITQDHDGVISLWEDSESPPFIPSGGADCEYNGRAGATPLMTILDKENAQSLLAMFQLEDMAPASAVHVGIDVTYADEVTAEEEISDDD